MRPTLLFTFLALSHAGCGDSHSAGDDAGPGTPDAATDAFVGAYLTPSCAPDDGQAYELLLFEAAVPECSADDTRRSLRFYFFEGTDRFFPIEAGETISSDTAGSGFGNGQATSCPGGTPPCLVSNRWSITFDAFEDGTGASGSYSVTFADGDTATGRFDASWCAPAPPMCG